MRFVFPQEFGPTKGGDKYPENDPDRFVVIIQTDPERV
jgi:hypothetical protein